MLVSVVIATVADMDPPYPPDPNEPVQYPPQPQPPYPITPPVGTQRPPAYAPPPGESYTSD